MPKPIGNSGRYMPGLDGLRAIAVIAVIAYHLNLSWLPGGLLGVGIFFVLSGYLITDILLKQQSKTRRLNLSDFWIRRARRLLPAMVLMLGFVTVWLLMTDPARLMGLRGEIGSALLYTSNWRLIFHEVSYFESFGPPSPLGHLWSLAVEEQFYLVWPLALALLVRWLPQRGKLALAILVLAGVSAGLMAVLYEPGLDPSRVYYGTDTRAFALLIGAALAAIWPSWKLSEMASRRTKIVLDITGFGGMAVVLYMIVTAGEYDSGLYRGGMMALSVATAAVVASLAHPASRISRVIGCGPLRWIGVRSYGIYLYHYPVIALTTQAAEAGEFHLIRALVQVAATIVLAELSWRFIEEPIRQGALGRLAGGVKKYLGRFNRGRHPMRENRALLLMSLSMLMVVSVSCSSQLYAIEGKAAKQALVGQAVVDETVGEVTVGHDAADHLEVDSAKSPIGAESDGEVSGKGSGEEKQGESDSGGEGHEGTAPDGADSGGTSSGGANSSGADPDGVKPGGSNSDAGKPDDTESSGTAPDGADPGGAVKPDGNGASDGSDSKGSGTGATKPNEAKPPAPGSVTVIGDSIILDAKPYLEELVKGIVVDGKVGRQMSEADDVALELKRQNKLGQTVIIELGTNGSFSEKQLNGLLTAIGSGHKVILVNTRVPRKWQDVVNDMLAEKVDRTPGLSLIDWYAASKGQDDFFGKDGVHLKKDGAKFFAQLLADSLAKIS
ncbi:acyltransferase family protein [Paenibacillus montanisoli]|uniref:Acetyltransferase n=1 Tax=Paenibacillus montanisoli TaxID=2081970 RepID=A0A328TWT1_9BACL|nr:acyltransferase family protein [Paenibacillus montanisoli]RAP74939.1 acetyltransferase [Paenibacillus montanisoli]